jgi:glycosyltransferase involved in cell wall biosynthesis
LTHPAPKRLTLGYLQVGPSQHGICRYGRLLAAEGRRRQDLVILEQNIVLTGKHRKDRRLLRAAARELSRADLVHIQVSVSGDGSWGQKWRALSNLRTFRRHCRAPLILTLHDVNSLAALRCGPLLCLRRAGYEIIKGLLRPGVRLARQLTRSRLHRAPLFSALWEFDSLYPCFLAHQAARVARVLFVLTNGEKTVLESIGIAARAVLIPHFVEESPSSCRPPAPPTSTMKTVIVAGFIFGSKGHQILLEAMPLFPDIKVVFVGGQSLSSLGSEHYTWVMNLARQKGVHDRLEVTGYLPDEEYQRYLAAADLAVCPFYRHKSASGSLSSLIAAGCPILASDIPLVAEYNAMVPGAISTFSPYTPEALATAIGKLLAVPRAELTRGLAELSQQLSISVIYDRHVQAYQRALELL